jgi:hypothetical protein
LEGRDLGQLGRTFSAWARLAATFDPATCTSTGVGEPKLMISLTMSAGSNETRSSRARRSATASSSAKRGCFQRAAVHAWSAPAASPQAGLQLVYAPPGRA